jgi:hypothetical protein
MTFEARDLAGHRVLVAGDDRPHVLRIEPRRQFGRADEVAEHHGQLTALGLARRRRRRGGFGRGR